MTDETKALRDKIRSYEISPCSHGSECKCVQRMEWEFAVGRVYTIERRLEALQDMVKLSEEMGYLPVISQS